MCKLDNTYLFTFIFCKVIEKKTNEKQYTLQYTIY